MDLQQQDWDQIERISYIIGIIAGIVAIIAGIYAMMRFIHSLVVRHRAKREVPSPNGLVDFDETRYLESLVSIPTHLIPLRGQAIGSASDGTSRASECENGPNSTRPCDGQPSAEQTVEEVKDLPKMLLALRTGDSCLISGRGGSGKTSTLRYLQGIASRARLLDRSRPLPILIELGKYRGSIAELVNASVGIRGGDWRNVAGGVLLLVDGLNEVPSHQLSNVASELSDRRLRTVATLVVTSRPLQRRTDALLHFSNYVDIPSLSVRDVVRIAEKRLVGRDLTDFLDQFRARFAAGTVRVLSLPFGVDIAVKVFLSSRHLPESETELVEAVVRSHLARDRDRANALPERCQCLPTATTSALVSSFAYEVRVRLGRVMVSEAEGLSALRVALEGLKQAKTFGISELLESDALQLLRHHEFVLMADDGWIRFPHEIMADHLAAKSFAGSWRQYCDSNWQAGLDEVWHFAASSIADSELAAYVRQVADHDLLLGCVCAKASGRPELTDIETRVEELASRGGWFASGQAARAITILATPKLRTMLRSIATRKPVDRLRDVERENAIAALARLGEEDVLFQVLEEAERMALFPGQVSGGNHDIWRSAPAHIALRLARRRLADLHTRPYIHLSLETIARFGDASDTAAVSGLMDAASDFHTFAAAFYTMHELDPGHATEKIRAQIGKHGTVTDIDLMKLCLQVGAEFDPTTLFDAWVELRRISGEARTDSVIVAENSAVEMLCKVPLPPALKCRLRYMFDAATPDNVGDLWRVAGTRQVEDYDQHALDRIGKAPIGEVGYIARFALAREWSADVERSFGQLAEDRLNEDKRLRLSWSGTNLAEYLAVRGRQAPVARFVDEEIGLLLDVEAHLGRGELPPIMTGGERRYEDIKIDHVRYAMQWDARRVLRIADLIGFALPKERLAPLLRLVDIHMPEGETGPIEHLMSCLEPDVIDEQLALRPVGDMPWFLMRLREKPPTPVRIALLKKMIAQAHLMVGEPKYLAEIADRYWSDDLARTIVETTASNQWHADYGHRFFGPIISLVADHSDEAVVKDAVAECLPKCNSDTSRWILEFWRDIGSEVVIPIP